MPIKTFQDMVADAKTRVKEMTVDQLVALRAGGQKVHVLDVREGESYLDAHIPGARSMPRGMLEMDVDEVTTDPKAPIITYCGGGSRSCLAADTLQKMGFQNVRSLAGGLKAWQAARQPTESVRAKR